MKSLSLNRFTFILALYYGLVLNIPFYIRAKQGFELLPEINWLFVGSLSVILIGLLAVIFSFFSFKYLAKPFFVVLTLMSATVVFAMFKYGIVFDRDMMENLFETNPAEASMYVNLESIGVFVLLGVIPAAWIMWVRIDYQTIGKELLHKLVFMVGMLAVSLGLAAVYFAELASFGRNNDDLRRFIVPTYFVSSAAKYVNQKYFNKPLPYEQIGLDARYVGLDTNNKPLLTVLVVGETSRSMNHQYYGYDRDTNAYTQVFDPIVFKDVVSCGTATAQSLPCMFSRMDRENYHAARAKAQDSVLDVLARAGVGVMWYDNDSGCKGVCSRLPHENIKLDADPTLCNGEACLDEILLGRLDAMLAKPIEQDTLIVLHMMGSHGPTYYQRYPKAHRTFTPDCPRSDIQNCTQQELVNTYDNTIRYSDYVIAAVIERLNKLNAKADTAMMYISDHGESLGEKGMYLHGAPYAIAPKEQISIPWLVWLSDGFVMDNKLNEQCLRDQTGPWSHDNLFDSLLGMMNVHTEIYRASHDVFAGCRVEGSPAVLTR